jgi:hypothetical protein
MIEVRRPDGSAEQVGLVNAPDGRITAATRVRLPLDDLRLQGSREVIQRFAHDAKQDAEPMLARFEALRPGLGLLDSMLAVIREARWSLPAGTYVSSDHLAELGHQQRITPKAKYELLVAIRGRFPFGQTGAHFEKVLFDWIAQAAPADLDRLWEIYLTALDTSGESTVDAGISAVIDALPEELRRQVPLGTIRIAWPTGDLAKKLVKTFLESSGLSPEAFIAKMLVDCLSPEAPPDFARRIRAMLDARVDSGASAVEICDVFLRACVDEDISLYAPLSEMLASNLLTAEETRSLHELIESQRSNR